MTVKKNTSFVFQDYFFFEDSTKIFWEIECRVIKKMSNVIFSFQGSFGPPTFGHLMSMFYFAKEIQKDYTHGSKTMLFMPSPGGSKTHLFPTRTSRTNILRIFCKILQSSFPDITFDVSDIEYNIAGPLNKSVATIHTLRKLNELKVSETDEICLGMGLDNAYQLPYWESVDEYSQHVRKIFVVHRDPTPAEIQNIRSFQVTNADASSAKLLFDVTIPSWTKAPFTQFFIGSSDDTISPSDPNRQALLLNKLTPSDHQDTYKFYGTLPIIVEIDSHGIPSTSSSMMRYFIGQGNREKVKNIMFGRYMNDQDAAVDEIMASYASRSDFDPVYEEQYNLLLL